MLGPDEPGLVLVRHGESLGNVADRRARELGHPRLDLEWRDADVPLSEVGQGQAEAVGRFVAQQKDDAPTVVVSSPFRRALDTAQIVLATSGLDAEAITDERLRERELGVFDGLTGQGIRQRFPEEAERRTHLGKFYYRPPGGESWCDVALRVRSALTSLRAEHGAERLWVFSHQAVIMSFRLVLERLDEENVLAIDSGTPVPNCSLTSYRWIGEHRAELVAYADTTAVDQAQAPTTREPDAEEAADGAS